MGSIRLVVGVSLWLMATAVNAATFSPHRTLYKLSLHVGSGDVTAVHGEMHLKFESSCDGWRVEQFLGFRLYGSQGRLLEHLGELTAWEPSDGLNYWFNNRTFENGQPSEEVSGVSRRQKIETAGEIQFSKPSTQSQTLPPNTRYPVAHGRELLQAALDGQRHLSRTVFDGSTLDSLFEVSTFIGKERAPNPKALPPLDKQRSWPLRIAYFRPGRAGGASEFELSADLYESGIAGRMIYDYHDFAMALDLTEVEMLPNPPCE